MESLDRRKFLTSAVLGSATAVVGATALGSIAPEAAFAEDDILLAGLAANSKTPDAYRLVEIDGMAADPYALMLRRDDPQFKALVEKTVGPPNGALPNSSKVEPPFASPTGGSLSLLRATAARSKRRGRLTSGCTEVRAPLELRLPPWWYRPGWQPFHGARLDACLSLES